jgi:hypothetical protein
MGKAAKAHRKKVAKRNANVKVQEKKMQKLWQEAFEEQMNVMKEKFASMSGDTNEELGLEENKDINKLFSEILTQEEGLKITDDVYKSFDKEYGKKLMNNISEEFVEKIKNIDINEENNDNTDSLQERMKKLKLEFNELIPIETEEEIEINQKFEEVIKILENDSDKKESKEESEPTEPISGE